MKQPSQGHTLGMAAQTPPQATLGSRTYTFKLTCAERRVMGKKQKKGEGDQASEARHSKHSHSPCPVPGVLLSALHTVTPFIPMAP